jgi:hypothetical protein
MKNFLIFLTITMLTGCVSTAKLFENYKIYEYSYRFEGNGTDSLLVFDDTIVNVRFVIGREGIGFTMLNKLNTPLRIIWDETSFIDGTNAEKIVHAGVKYSEMSNSQPPTLIPPGSSIEDEVTPVKNVRFDSGSLYSSPEWRVNPLFPRTDYGKIEDRDQILALKGHRFSLFMPVQNGNEIVDYRWKFEITDVRSKMFDRSKGYDQL